MIHIDTPIAREQGQAQSMIVAVLFKTICVDAPIAMEIAPTEIAKARTIVENEASQRSDEYCSADLTLSAWVIA